MARRPDPITQRINLEGGKEIAAQFRELGRIAQEAFAGLAQAARRGDTANQQLARSTDRVAAGTAELAEESRRLGQRWQDTGREARRLGDDLRTVGRRVATATAAVATGIAAIGAAASALARSGAQAVEAASRTAEGLGLTVAEYGRLEFAAAQAGVSTEQFGAALNALNTRVAEAVKAGKELTDNLGLHPERWAEAQRANALGIRSLDKTAESGDRASQALRKLGISLRDGQGNVRSGRDLLLDIADAFRALPPGIEEAGLAAAVFGEDLGRRMLPFLNLGADGIRAFEREGARLGVAFTDEQARIATAFVAAEDRLRRAVAGLRHQIGLLFAPALTRRAERLTEVLVANRDALLGFAEVALARTTALVEDLFAAFAGRDQDVRSGWVLAARDAVLGFAEDLRGAWENIIRPAFAAILKAADRVAEALNEALGTDLSGRQLLIAGAVAHVIGLFDALVTGVTLASGLLGAWPVLLAGAIAAFDPGIWRAAVELVQDLGAALSGRDEDVRNEWILEARDGIKAFAKDVRTVVTDILVPLFETLLEAFDKIAAGINKVFGTEFTGRQVLIAAIVLKLIGFFDTLRGIVSTVASTLFGLLAGGKIVSGIVRFIAFISRGAVLLGLLFGGLPALIVGAIAVAAALIIIYWDDIVAAAKATFDAIPELAQAGWDGLMIIWRGLGATFDELLAGVAVAFERLWDGVVARAERALDRLLALWRRLRDLIAGVSSPEAAAAANAGGVPLLAKGGGPLQGPGSETSDSILARLSKGEFVVRARAVAYYGADALRALNGLQLPKFDTGGLVAGIAGGLQGAFDRLGPAGPLPAFAEGGPVLASAGSGAGGTPITLVLDGRRFPVTAERDVAEALTHSALARQRRRAGKLPDWYGG